MKWLIVLIAVMAIAGVYMLILVQMAASYSSTGPQACNVMSTAVKILHTWKQPQDSARYVTFDESLGTIIGPNLVLTHQHFTQPLGRLPEEIFTFEDGVGRTIWWRAVDLKLTAIDAGTLLIRRPADVFPTSAFRFASTAVQRLNEDGNALGRFNVALLPSRVTEP